MQICHIKRPLLEGFKGQVNEHIKNIHLNRNLDSDPCLVR